METPNLIIISIPKPCHEDWNKMTPNEQGSFCGKCCKTVVDFTTKSNQEITTFLVEQSNAKICGRFKSEQLSTPLSSYQLTIPLHSLPKNISISKSFAIALFFSFGTTLFSCTTQEWQTVGEIAVVDTTKVVKANSVSETIDSVETKILGDTVRTVIKKTVMGKLAAPVKCTPIQGDVAVEYPKGEIITTDTTSEKKDSLQNEIKVGQIKIQEKK
jgi:hypothetical protein